MDYDLRKLYEAAEAACAAAFEQRHEINGAINWADLHCVDAEKCESVFGHITYRVWIEECSFDNYKLSCFIKKYLDEAGFAGVETQMEW